LLSTGQYGIGWNGAHLFKLADGTLKYIANAADVPKDAVEKGVTGLLYGDPSQFVAQLVDCGVLCVFGFTVAFILFKVSNLITPIRVSRETELAGLDMPEMGALGWPDFEHSGQSGPLG
jgi:ammonia channel protein AmtB